MWGRAAALEAALLALALRSTLLLDTQRRFKGLWVAIALDRAACGNRETFTPRSPSQTQPALLAEKESSTLENRVEANGPLTTERGCNGLHSGKAGAFEAALVALAGLRAVWSCNKVLQSFPKP